MNARVSGYLREQLLPAVLCVGLAFALGATPWWRRLEAGALDQFTVLRSYFQPPADQRLVTVAIDDDGLMRFGRWPWSRNVHAQFMYSLSHGKPAAMAWDILFTEPTDEDAKMVVAAGTLGGRVIFGAYTSDEDPQQSPGPKDITPALTRIEGAMEKIPTSPFALLPEAALRAVALTAFCDTPGDRRRVPMLQRVGNRVLPSLSLQSLLVYWHLKPEQVRVVLGDGIYLEGPGVSRRIPIDEQGRYFVNYRFGMRGANTLGYGELLVGYTEHFLLKKPHPDLPSVENKILLIGQVSTALTDNGVTPFGNETPLVFVHANIIDNILREDYARRSPDWPVLLGAMLLSVAGLGYLQKKKLHLQAIYALGVPILYVGVVALLWATLSLAVPLLWPMLGFASVQIFMIVRQLVRERRSKEKIKGMFGTYLSPTLVNRMIESGQSPQLGGHEENITAYFSDIQSFSTFSELLPPDRLVDLMNEYLTACTDIIQEEGGTLDKYIGDAVVAIFGAPLPLPDHALRACVASQRIHLRLDELREKWKSDTAAAWPKIVHEMQSRIGLNSGLAVVGNIGSRSRFNYTMMGDNVNLAARMESGAKSWGVYSMCADATRAACVRDGGDRVVFRPLGRIVVKGRTSAVPIFEIVGLKENVSDQTRECLRLFESGLAAFYRREWLAALEFFAQSEKWEPRQPGVTVGVTSNPSLVYREITRRYQLTPPPEGWQGEYVMTEK